MTADISLIIGTYNRLNKLKKTINSIINNFYGNLKVEIILIDGGSTDGTYQYFNSIKNKFYSAQYFNEGKLNGVVKAYNVGYMMATGRYTSWLSDDFVLQKDCLKEMMKACVTSRKKDILAYLNDLNDGRGYHCPHVAKKPFCYIGTMLTSSLRESFGWIEDYKTYGVDIDQCYRIYRWGGRVIPVKGALIKHDIDLNDELHKLNVPDSKKNNDSKRCYDIFKKNKTKSSGYSIPNVFVGGADANVIYNKAMNFKETKYSYAFFYCKLSDPFLIANGIFKAGGVSFYDIQI